jgi:subtilisin family serine protease
LLSYLQDDETNALRDAADVAIRDKMHIINLSLGINTWIPEEADVEGIRKAAAAGILMAAAAGNEGEEAGLQSVIHPSWDPNVFSVAMLANTVTAGAAVVLSGSVLVNGNSTDRIGELLCWSCVGDARVAACEQQFQQRCSDLCLACAQFQGSFMYASLAVARAADWPIKYCATAVQAAVSFSICN